MTHSSWILQQASRSSHGFSPGHPVHPTPQNFPYRIPTAIWTQINKLIKLNPRLNQNLSKEIHKITYNYNFVQRRFCCIWPVNQTNVTEFYFRSKWIFSVHFLVHFLGIQTGRHGERRLLLCYLGIIVGAPSDDCERDQNDSASGGDTRPGGNTRSTRHFLARRRQALKGVFWKFPSLLRGFINCVWRYFCSLDF